MKLAVDKHHLLLENAGTKRVTLSLLNEFKKITGLEILSFQPKYQLKRGNGIFGKIAGHLVRFFWVHIHLPYLCVVHKVDVLFSPEFNTPLFTHCKRAVIAHDANLRAQREYTSSLWFYFYYIPFIEYAIRRADVIFTVSHFAAKQITELMRLDEKKVVVVHNGIDDHFINSSFDKARQYIPPAGLESGKYILFVGTFESRKNIERLIIAFSRVRENYLEAANLKLAIAGNSSTSKYSDRSKDISNLIAELGLENYIVLCGFVADEHLPELYRNASVIAFPSLHEGFGLPIIEGFATGVPVLTSNICSMPEIAGGAAVLADPYDTTDLTKKLAQVLFDPFLRKTLIADGFIRLKEFNWANSASSIINQLKTLL